MVSGQRTASSPGWCPTELASERTMLDHLTGRSVPSWIHGDPVMAGSLERASRAIARLDQALDGHPLLPAFLYRTRLEAVRRQAAVDGLLIAPWHLAGGLDGFRR